MSNWRQYKLDDIIINFISFNVGSFNTDYFIDKSLNSIVKTEITNIFTKDPNTIWVVTTQEDATNSTLINIIKSYMTSAKIIYNGGALNNDGSSYNNPQLPPPEPQIQQLESQQQSSSRPKTIKKGSNYNKLENTIKYITLFHKTASSHIVQYNLHLAIFVPEKLKSFLEIGKSMIEFHENSNLLKSLAHTKASIITHLKIKIGIYHNLLIVASHLPVDTNDKYTLVTKTNAKKNYFLKDEDLDKIDKILGKSAYGPTTYFTTANLINYLCEKHNLAPDQLNDFIINLINQRNSKSNNRNKKIEGNKKNKMGKRREKLIKELSKFKLELRNDSVLCQNYIEGKSSHDLDDIVKRMCEMKYLFEYCHMDECKQIIYDECDSDSDSSDSSYSYSISIFKRAEILALKKYSNGKYPSTFPWLV